MIYGKLTVNPVAVAKFDTAAAGGLEGDERWQLVQRIAASQTFAGSPQLQSFLVYVAEHALLGRPDAIKEQAIGSRVLGRKPDYDPANDNIVRVRARQLRLKIDQYFRTEGIGERLLLEIPKGGYVPNFESRLPAGAPAIEAPIRSEARRAGRLLPWLPWAAAGILALACILLLVRLRNSDTTRLPGDRRLWVEIFPGQGQDTLLVLGDSGVALWQDLTHRSLSLADYLGMKFLGTDSAAPGFREVARRRFTSLADVNLATRFFPLARAMGSNMKLRLARNIDVHDVESGNAILLGSRRANPWVELFEPHLHYAWEYDDQAGRSFFRGRQEAHVEPAILAGGESQGRQKSYALIAMLPNASRTGRVLVVEGLSMEGTDAAGQFLLNPESSSDLARRVAAELGSVEQPFEALLELTPVAGGSANSRLMRVFRPLP